MGLNPSPIFAFRRESGGHKNTDRDQARQIDLKAGNLAVRRILDTGGGDPARFLVNVGGDEHRSHKYCPKQPKLAVPLSDFINNV
jgi:hypothetical protein